MNNKNNILTKLNVISITSIYNITPNYTHVIINKNNTKQHIRILHINFNDYICGDKNCNNINSIMYYINKN